MTESVSIEEAPETPEVSVGERLRTAREGKSLELRDVARETRQSQDTLAALESEDTDHIPDSILRLQARNYARFLGLPEEEIASAYAEARVSMNAAAMPAETARATIPPKAILVGAGAALTAIAMIGGVVMWLSTPAPESTDQLAISARLAPAFDRQAEIVSLVAESDEEFFIRAKSSAWIEVRGSDGTVFRNREMQAGETYYPRMGAGWTITVRDAGAFEWYLGDSSAGQIGEAEQALYSVSVDTAMQSAQAARTAALAEANDAAQRPR
ncbi:MAG: RodZ domain-containing protein [Pseudomonadota bacterium]